MATSTGLIIHKPKRESIAYTEPAQEPVPLEEAKAEMRITAPDDDASISRRIRDARRYMERFTQRALITQTAIWKISDFPDRLDAVLELPGGKVQSVTSITYVDTAGATQTWGASNYDVDTAYEPGRIALAYNQEWPIVREWNLPITITYTVGYGDDPGDVPSELRTAIIRIAAELIENREETIIGAPIARVVYDAKMLANPYRLRRII